MIRFFIGLLLAFGSVGGMEDPNNNLLLLVFTACIGLLFMASGVKRMNQSDEF